MSKNDRSVNYEWHATYSGSSNNWNNREMYSLQNLYEETAFSDYRWFLFSLWSCQLISSSSNSQCLARMLYFSIASFKGPCRSRESQVELVCLEPAGRKAEWQYPCLNRGNIWWEHIRLSWCCCCGHSLRSQTICMYTWPSQEIQPGPSSTPSNVGNPNSGRLQWGQHFDLWIERAQCPFWV